MSNTEFNEDNLELELELETLDKLNKGFGDLNKKYSKLKKENHGLKRENNLLKELVLENLKEKNQNSLREEDLLNPLNKSQKIGKSFYIQIILGISIIILMLGFHILYLAVTSCLMYNNGDSGCWIVNWLGGDIHASFYLDIILYSLIMIQVILLILIIRSKLNEKKQFFISSPR